MTINITALAQAIQAVNGEATDADDYNSNNAAIRTTVNALVTAINAINLNDIPDTNSGVALSALIPNYMRGLHVYRVDDSNIGVSIGEAMIDGKMRALTTAKTDLTYSTPTSGHWLDVWIGSDTAAEAPQISAITSGSTTPGQSSNPYTSGRHIGSIRYDSTNKLNSAIQYRPDYIEGWAWAAGSGAQALTDTVKFGKTFTFAPHVIAQLIGRQDDATLPTNIGACQTALTTEGLNSGGHSITTTQFTFWGFSYAVGPTTFDAGNDYYYTWRAEGGNYS